MGAINSDSKDIAKGGLRWFLVVGPLSILVTVSLYKVDRYLSENDKELQKGELLRELRTAQAGLITSSYDDRQSGHSLTSTGISEKLKTLKPSDNTPTEPSLNEELVPETAPNNS